MPFLDDSFAHASLLAAVAALRQTSAERLGLTDPATRPQATRWLAPELAQTIRTSPLRVPTAPLTEHQQNRINDVLTAVAALIPPWRPLLGLPVQFLLMTDPQGAISASVYDWPQHVLLGPDAFADDVELREQLIHELSHQWLYLIQESWTLVTPDAHLLTLPSGTADRTPVEVLGAAHVAATLLRLHRADPSADLAHVAALHRYGTGCLALLDTAAAFFSPHGHTLVDRLQEALRS